jgi:hypothetical protein
VKVIAQQGAVGILLVTEVDPTHIKVVHVNDDDHNYEYEYEVEGTPEEIAVIKSFCEKLTAHAEPLSFGTPIEPLGT